MECSHFRLFQKMLCRYHCSGKGDVCALTRVCKDFPMGEEGGNVSKGFS